MTTQRRNALISSVALASAAFVLLTAAGGYCEPRLAPEPKPPSWFTKTPAPASAQANYFYMSEIGEGASITEATEKAWQTALKNARARGAVEVGTPERQDRCKEILNVTRDSYKIYVLFKVQRYDRESDVFNKENDVECKDRRFLSELDKYNADIARRQKEFDDDKARRQRDVDARDAKKREEDAKLQKIEVGIAEVSRDVDRAKGLANAGRKKDAQDLVTQSERRLETLPYYGDLPLDAAARDRIGGAISRLREEISAVKFILKEKMSFFVDGLETLEGARSANVAAKLKNQLSKKGYEVMRDRGSASYYLNFEANACKVGVNAYIDMVTCEVCAKAQLINLTTGRNEGSVDFTSKSEVGDTKEAACGKAADNVADGLWNKLLRDVGVFSN